MHLGSQVCNLVHIMMALMTDLGLGSCGAYKNCRPTYANGAYFSNRGPVPVAAFATDKPTAIPISRTLEGCRTFLGCFYLSSMYEENRTLTFDSSLTNLNFLELQCVLAISSLSTSPNM